MKPGPDFRHPSQQFDRQTVRPDSGRIDNPIFLSEDQRRLISALQAQEHGMTVRQLEARLAWPGGGIQELLDGLVERHLVARLNTLVPSYTYRFGGLDLDVD